MKTRPAAPMSGPMRKILHLLLLRWAWGWLAVATLGASTEFSAELGAIVDDASGMDWTLPGGETLHLRILDDRFQAFFLNEAREIIEPTLEKVILRGEETRNKTNEFNLPLRRAGLSLSHPRRFYPPYDYWVIGLVPHEGKDSTVLPRQRFRP